MRVGGAVSGMRGGPWGPRGQRSPGLCGDHIWRGCWSRPDSVAVVRLAIDATPLLGAPTGVGSFTRGLLVALADHPVDRVAYALSWEGRRALGEVLPPGVARAPRPMVAQVLLSLWRRWSWPPVELWTGAVDVVHGTNFVVPPTRRAARVVTVHDLTALRHPEMCTPTTLGYPALIARAVAEGAIVHTPSEAMAEEVRDAFAVEPERVRAVHNGVDAPAPGDAGRGRGLAGAAEYVLALGTIEPRKDHVTLVRAFTRIAEMRPALHLVIAGSAGWGADAVRDAISASSAGARIHLPGYVDAAERADLLAGARALVYPSRYEGFGLPPLEAMSAGVPVIATDLPALREVLGDAALIVPAADADVLAGAIEAILDDDALRSRLVAAGKRRASVFSWSACASGLMQLYREAAS